MKEGEKKAPVKSIKLKVKFDTGIKEKKKAMARKMIAPQKKTPVAP